LLRTPPCSWMWWACPEGGGIRFVPEAARQLEHSSDHGSTAYKSPCSCAAMIPTPHRSHLLFWLVQGVMQVVVGEFVPETAAPSARPRSKLRSDVDTQLLLQGCSMGHNVSGYAAACERLAHTVTETGLFLRRPGCRGPPQVVVKPCAVVNVALLLQCLGLRGAMWCCGGGTGCCRWWWGAFVPETAAPSARPRSKLRSGR
jgi:hypothetical protein